MTTVKNLKNHIIKFSFLIWLTIFGVFVFLLVPYLINGPYTQSNLMGRNITILLDKPEAMTSVLIIFQDGSTNVGTTKIKWTNNMICSSEDICLKIIPETGQLFTDDISFGHIIDIRNDMPKHTGSSGSFIDSLKN